VNAPDYISPVVGYRAWVWDAAGLKSLNGESWFPGRPLSALCRADRTSSISGLSKGTHNPNELPYLKCTCGVYAAKTIEHLHQCGYRFGIYGEVYLWGAVVEHERGWRGQFGYPKSLFLSPDTMPFTLRGIQSRVRTLASYRVDVFVADPKGNIPLWSNGSGFDQAGLDYLINMSTEYYERRRQERTLKKGDRVAVLGRGIALVGPTDEKEVSVVLWNRQVLKIARKKIVWDECNMRWECKALLEEQ
jgi:hypothetical protein